jgi:hypothetical protein
VITLPDDDLWDGEAEGKECAGSKHDGPEARLVMLEDWNGQGALQETGEDRPIENGADDGEAGLGDPAYNEYLVVPRGTCWCVAVGSCHAGGQPLVLSEAEEDYGGVN